MIRTRIYIAIIIFVVVFSLIAVRMFYLQILRHNELQQFYPISAIYWNLPLDKNIQQIADKILKRYLNKHPDIYESLIIVSLPSEGNIIAFAHYGSNTPAIEAKPILLLMMVAAGIEHKCFDMEQTRIGSYSLNEYFLDPSNIDTETLASCAKNIGIRILAEYFESFGVGQGGTFLFLPGEGKRTFDLQELVDKEQGILLTPLQITKIVGIIANDGIFQSSSVILKGTSDVLKNILKNAVNYGTGKEVKITGYELGGIGFIFSQRGCQQIKDSAFVGFTNTGFSDDKIVIFSMIRVKSKASVNISKINRDLFRRITYETIRYLERIEIQRKVRS